ncbi:MAG: archaeosine biosynthesis radical SAM protein RaSEA [Thermoplasmata archaeon]
MIDRILQLRKSVSRDDRPEDYVSLWFEDEPFKGGRERSMVLVLRTMGCFWFYKSGCTMCGYYNDTNPTKVNDHQLMEQVEKAKKKYKGEKIVKIYNSGSFFDSNEISEEAQNNILKSFSESERIIVETRPEFVNAKLIERMSEFKEKLMVAIGLESSNDEVLEYSINKGFKSSTYERAAELLFENNFSLKTYIILKPPFLSEKKSIEDAVKSIEFASKYSEIISLNPVNVQTNTIVEELWKKGYYRPPWLWSVVEVLKRTAYLKKVVSFPTAPGTRRGAHNCDKCDDEIIRAIEDFSFSQDINVLNSINDCNCKIDWKKILEIEDLTFSTIGDQ